jgi:DNA-binding IscR family transcriptional regulator
MAPPACIRERMLGGELAHVRFVACTVILATMLSRAPFPVDSRDLLHSTGCSMAELGPLCTALARMGIVRPLLASPGIWTLRRAAHRMTLDDVLQALMRSIAVRHPAPQPPPCAASDGTSLLLAQAAMQVELSLSKHLGGYSLRLLSSAPPVRHRTCHPGQAWRDGEATAVHETARWNAI